MPEAAAPIAEPPTPANLPTQECTEFVRPAPRAALMLECADASGDVPLTVGKFYLGVPETRRGGEGYFVRADNGGSPWFRAARFTIITVAPPPQRDQPARPVVGAVVVMITLFYAVALTGFALWAAAAILFSPHP